MTLGETDDRGRFPYARQRHCARPVHWPHRPTRPSASEDDCPETVATCPSIDEEANLATRVICPALLMSIGVLVGTASASTEDCTVGTLSKVSMRSVSRRQRHDWIAGRRDDRAESGRATERQDHLLRLAACTPENLVIRDTKSGSRSRCRLPIRRATARWCLTETTSSPLVVESPEMSPTPDPTKTPPRRRRPQRKCRSHRRRLRRSDDSTRNRSTSRTH